MKIRFGALALVAALAACSGQDRTMTGEAHKEGRARATQPAVGPAIAGYSKDSQRTLGNAPDRGELFTYKKGAAVLHKGAYTLRPIALSEEHAIRGVATGMMTIPGPNGSDIKIRYQRHEESPDGNWSWIGRVVGGDQGREAIITFGEHAVFGSIPQANGPSLQLTTEHGIAYLVQADATRLFRGTRVGGDTKVPAAYGASSANEAESLVASATQKIQAQALAVNPKAVPAANTVDLVAGYSNGLATRLGGASIAVTKLVSLVAAANTALANSNINGQIRLVGALQVSYADNTDNGTALNELTGNNGTGAVTVPASLAPLRAARETYGADLVTLVRDFKSENNGCGIAWLIGAKQQPITVAGDAPFAYSVVSEGSYVNGTSTLYCEDITLAHELAHNMGSAHDAANAPDPGRYPYSYGYKTAAAQGNFFTVMAYGENNQTLYRVFSNPLITTCGGVACGVANQADNARSLNQTIPVVATFRASVLPFDTIVRNDVNGDRKSDLLWNSPSTGQFAYWLMNGATISATAAFSVDGSYSIIGTGDFDGNGYTDILWRHVGGLIYMWLGNANGGYTGQTIYALGNNWRLAGTGDVNGDGKSDLLWSSPSTSQFVYWAMDGGTISYTYALNIDSAFTAIGTGDLDGNGRVDIVWRNASGQTYAWLAGTNGLYTAQYIGVLSADWKLVGTGDVNGDGKADLLWSRPSSSQFVYWVMNGAVVSSTYAFLIDSSYTAIGTGDLDGNGRVDIVWRNNAGQTYAWFGQTNGLYNTLFLSTLGTNWSLPPG